MTKRKTNLKKVVCHAWGPGDRARCGAELTRGDSLSTNMNEVTCNKCYVIGAKLTQTGMAPSLGWRQRVEARAAEAAEARAARAEDTGEPLLAQAVSYSGKFMLRVPAKLHERLVRLAAKEHRSLNAQINYMLEQSLYMR